MGSYSCRRVPKPIVYLVLGLLGCSTLGGIFLMGIQLGTLIDQTLQPIQIEIDIDFQKPPPHRRSLREKHWDAFDFSELKKDMNNRKLFISEAPRTSIQITSLRHEASPRMVALDRRISLTNIMICILRWDWGQHESLLVTSDSSSTPPQIDEGWFVSNAQDFQEYPNDCEPYHDWQLKSFDNCLAFHELNFFQMKVINAGGEHIVFEASDFSGISFVYKTWLWGKDLSDDEIEAQRMDSLIMERLSSSSFIPDIYGRCGLGTVMPLMPRGDMLDYVGLSRFISTSTLLPLDKLKVSYHVARAVADLHTKALFYHGDLLWDQFLFQDGVFKLSDFCYGGALYRNKTSHKMCTRRYYNGDDDDNGITYKGRSLEEFQRILSFENYTDPEPTAIDVWMMGNILFTILTNEYIFETPYMGWEDAARALIAGKLSPMPVEIASSNDPSILVLIDALNLCWTYKWEKRPSAEFISTFLFGHLTNFTGQVDPDMRVMLPEQDPKKRMQTKNDYHRAMCDRDAHGNILGNCMR